MDERANREGANKGSNNQTQAPSTENRWRKSNNYWQKRKGKKQQKKQQQQQQQQQELPPPPPPHQQQHQQSGEKSSTSKNRKRARRKPQDHQASGYVKKELPVRPDTTGRIAGQPRNTSTYYEKGRFNLNAIKELSPSEVQSILACHAKGLKSRVQSGNEENEEAQDNINLLRALALACNAGKSENLTKILSAIKGSKFLCNQLPSMLREMQQDEQGTLDELSKRQVIVDMISLYQTFLRSLPSAYSDLPLDEVQRYFRKISITDKNDLQTKLDALKTERDEYIQDTRIKSTKPCKQRNINKKPPNNFRELQICPTVQELASEEKPFLRANVKKGSYENVEHYLDVQFRLYREDFITPLRDGIREIVHKVPRAERDQNIKTYDKVQITKKEYSRNGVIYTIHFDVSRFKTTRWDSSRRLIFGSFLCLSKDNFANILFATVANRDPKQLSKGYLDISFVEGQNIHGIELRKADQYVMAESPAYFEAYRHVLAALQNLRDGSLPFQKYLVECSREVDAPAYLRDQDEMVRYDLSEALDVPQVKEAMDVPLLDSDKWPNVSQLPLNDSQYEALRTALTKEFSVIQGPPGTGKTYVGLKIARCLLTNSHAWNPTNDSPILMVCFTNHALDQFLEGILDFLKDGIIRVGSRCKSERLDRCNLKIKVNIGYEQRQANRVKLAKQQRRIKSSKNVFEELDRHDDIIRINLLEDSSCISKENLDNLYFSSLYGEECKRLQDVFESWICNKANTRLQVNSSEVTLEFKPDCPVPSQRRTEADDAQNDTEEGNDSDDEQGWGVADPDLPRTLTSCDDEDSESSDLDENNVEGNEDTKNSDNTDPIKDILYVDQAKLIQVNSESTAEYPEGDGETSQDPRPKQDDLCQENSDLVVESQKISDTALNAYAPLSSLQLPGDVIDPQAFGGEDATQDDAEGWTEVKSKKKTTVQKLLPQPTEGNENQEMPGSSKQQIDLKDVKSNIEDTAGSNEVETIDIQQEMDYEQQTRYIVGEEDAFRPINLTLELSDLDDDTIVEQSERENLSKGEITNENAPNALQETSDPKTINKTCEDQSKNVEKARQNHPERVEREESATDPLESMLNQETKKKKKKNTKNKATAKDIREAKEKMKNLTKMREEEIDDIKDIWELTHDNRLRLYLTWVDMLKEYYKQRIIQEEQAYDGVCKEIDNLRMVEEEQILKKAKVIGMTTTGAARYHSVLQRIKPRIVIIEEAAEVLEAHIITSLARDTEQIILIGDHKQLRPKPTMYNLAIKYNLEISLFERMVLNDMDCKMLSIQHRMRPEIAHLTKRIYEDTIDDHKTVNEFENVRGMKTNLFFLDHHEIESFKGGLQSYANKHEASMMVALCRYLLQQEYKPSQITILTMYTGQLLALKDMMPRKEFEGVRVTVVDNFQGEENDIILLSLVRSNTTGSIGFLKESNRICVALSRARKGFYCIGNFGLLSKDRLWKEICDDLRSKESLSDSIQLACINHGNVTLVRNVEDFKKVPFGGCGLPCDLRLPCGHRCPSTCHGSDPEHANSRKCQKACSSQCPAERHRCQARCHYPAECDLCPVPVSKMFPECGHEDMIACGMDPKMQICHYLDNKTLACGHQKAIPCFLDPLESLKAQRNKILEEKKALLHLKYTHRLSYALKPIKDEEFNKYDAEIYILKEKLSTISKHGVFYESALKCEEKCQSLCKRGIHVCEKTCHYGEDCAPCTAQFEDEIPRCGHRVQATCNTNFEALVCEALCTRILECGHPCKAKCKVVCASYQCQMLCPNVCENNHPCRRTCHFGSPCGECVVFIDKVLPCNHIARDECHVDASTIDCLMPCERKRTCGHPCKKKCYESCESSKCKVKELKTLSCRHEKVLPCHLEPSQRLCQEEVIKELPCGHNLKMPCNMDPLQYLCEEEVIKEIPCGHKIQMPCTMDPSKHTCTEEVTRELKCGHKIQMPCNMDPSKHICTEEAIRELACGHKIQMPCNMDPSKHICTEEVTRELPCGHKIQMPCNVDTTKRKCVEIVERELSCGHKIHVPCEMDISKYCCSEQTTKTLPCGHEIQVPCNMDLSKHICREEVMKKLRCGHENQIPCHTDPSMHLCTTTEKIKLPCGHIHTHPCHLGQSYPICSQQVTRELRCGHEHQMQCHLDPSQFICTKQVQKKLPCDHYKLMSCHMDIAHAICTEQVVKTLQCGHENQMSCNFNPSDFKCKSSVKKELKCGHTKEVPCTKSLNEAMIICNETVEKKLPCEHLRKMPCSEEPKDVLCDALVERELTCGHVKKVPCHGRNIDSQCREDVIKALPCKHKKQMPCQENPENPDVKCDAMVTRELQCGHEGQVPCNMDVNYEISCDKLITRSLSCGHDVEVLCNMDISEITCDKLTTWSLPCGHDVQVPCNMDINQISCDKLTKRSLPCGHDVEVPCNIDISEISCDKLTKMSLPCGHDVEVPCSMDISEIPCDKLTRRSLPCGHDIEVPCSMDISEISCDKLTRRSLPCGHDVEVHSNMDINQINCDKLTTRSLPCGHDVQAPCRKNIETDTCDELVKKQLSCGHEMELPCHVDVNTISCDKHTAANILSSNDKTDKSCDKGISCNKLSPKSSHSSSKYEIASDINVNTTLSYKLVMKQLPCGHYFEMPCSADISKIVCCELTKKRLPCGHGVEMPCNEDVNKVACEVSTRKHLSCKHEVEIPCHMDVNTISCDKLTSKTLPCSHTKDIPCNTDVTSILCDKLVIKTLSCKHEVEIPCNMNVNTISCHKLTSKTLPCGHTKDLPCNIDVTSILCDVLVMKKLSCKHEVEIPCNMNVNTISCDKLTSKTLPCGHTKDLPCNIDVSTILCDELMVKKLPCNHEIELPCHKDQKEYICQRPCERFLPCNHQCKQKCYEVCDPNICTERTTKTAPCPKKHKITVPCNVKLQDKFVCHQQVKTILKCGHIWQGECSESTLPFRCEVIERRTLACPGKHQLDLPCYVDIRDIPCDEQCSKILRCGHPCKLYCDEPCNPKKCDERVPKTFSPCGHKKWLPCGISVKAICRYRCLRLLKDCGHPCQAFCGKPCNKPCFYKVRKTLPCGHKLKMKCCDPAEYVRCPSPCTARLPCGHVCTGNCATCQERGEHPTCPLPCGRALLCSHRCHNSCADTCSSCPRECRGWCPHGRCHGRCSESCEPCIMPCANTCPHRKCSNLCHEMCDCEPCNEPCHKMLTCGHSCIGLCGETCPTVCYVCTPAKVAAVSPNRQRNKDLRFIQLKECGHVIEVNRMDAWMQKPLDTAPNGQAQPRRCPTCSVPIYFSFRYGNIVREALQMMFESDSFKEAREIVQTFTRRGARIRPIQYRKPKSH